MSRLIPVLVDDEVAVRILESAEQFVKGGNTLDATEIHLIEALQKALNENKT